MTQQSPSARPSRAERRASARQTEKARTHSEGGPINPGGISPLRLPFIAIVIFAAFCLLPRVLSSSTLLLSYGLAVGALAALFVYLRMAVSSSGRELTYQFVPVRVHYVQMTLQACIYTYWGLYWDEVYTHIPLIVSQVAFYYALDMMVSWSRRDNWIFGFAPIPIVFSTNLFLWFHDDWFWLQFVLIAAIVLFKEFVRWQRNGRSVHIFNPSSIALFVFSLALIFTSSTGMTWGAEMAGTLQRPPNIYFLLFGLGVVVQALFSVTLVTLASAAVVFVFGTWFTHTTGEYYFIDSNVHAAVFLGMHLLVTDPVTSPRRMTGKVIFGGLYGAAVLAAYAILQHYQAPQFYDKLLCVPFLNLMVRALDRWSEAFSAKFHPLQLLQRFGPMKLNYAHMAMWAGLFATMVGTGFLGRGNSLQQVECENNNADSCLAYGLTMIAGQSGEPVAKLRGGEAIGRACNLGLAAGCQSLSRFVKNGGLEEFQKGCDKGDMVACYLSGWVRAKGQGVRRNDGDALRYFAQSCAGQFKPACEAVIELNPKQ